MVFSEYYDMWNKYGVKLASNIEITKEILDQVSVQSEVCDLIWAANAANQSNKSPAILSNTVMGQVRKLLPLLLNHKSCSNYSGADVEKRALRHFTSDDTGRFKKRQTKIRNVLEGFINKNSMERSDRPSVADSISQGEIPTWDEIQTIYRKNAKPGENIPPDRLKGAIKDFFQKQARSLHSNWWEETKNILRKESEK